MPAAATVPGAEERLADYVSARAADALGNPEVAAQLMAEILRERPDDAILRQRAIGAAIEAGDMSLALSLGERVGFANAALELRMLLAADELRNGKPKNVVAMLADRTGALDSTFLLPFVEAWARADRRDSRAIDSLASVGEQSALGRQVDEHRALILLKLKRPAEALPNAERALANAGGRADRLRMAFADGFRAAGDTASAAKMLDAGGPALGIAQARLSAGRPLEQAIDSSADAFGELMLGLALSVNRTNNKALAVALAQVARHANPGNSAASLLLALLLDDLGREDDALKALRTIAPTDPFASQSEDAQTRILLALDRGTEARARAEARVRAAPSADSWSRLGAIQSDLDDFAGAAESYARSIALVGDGSGSDEPWMLHLFRAGALEDANRWAESKAEIEAAMKLSPDNALLLNFMGYGKLEHGEDLDAAEAMVRRASALRPEDASITDSLGWAQYKRGKLDEAVSTLQRAAEMDPNQAEIREHLGDALFTAGRRIEARFAWRAALVTVDEAAARARLESKLSLGLTTANAAP